MASPHIIRVPRTDEDGANVLGQVTASGSKPLNVKVVATEGEEPYVVKCEFPLFMRYVPVPRVLNEEWLNVIRATQ